MDTSDNERNRVQTERPKALRRLSDEELGRPVGEHWTVAVALAHIGDWDGRGIGAIEAWRRHGCRLELWGGVVELAVNDARLPFWQAIPPREALEQAIRAAEALDALVADLDAAEVAAVAAQRYRALDRSRHRSEHLDEIDQALAT
jgi:hypothetical protein